MLYVFIWIVCGLIAGYLYQQRGRSEGMGFIGGLLLGPIGIVLALLTPTRLLKCPYCAERVQPEAKVCRYCGRELPLDLIESTNQNSNKNIIVFGVIFIGVMLLLCGMILASSS